MERSAQKALVKTIQRVGRSLRTQDKALTTLVREVETMLLLTDKALAAAKRAGSRKS